MLEFSEEREAYFEQIEERRMRFELLGEDFHRPCHPEGWPAGADEPRELAPPRDPDCTCDIEEDCFDATGCEAHDPRSRWNRGQRAVTSIERYLGEVA